MRRFVAPLAIGASCLLPRVAFALEAPSVDDDDREEASALEELGPRGNMRTRADTVAFDTQARYVELAGNVRIDSPPFHLRSDRIKLTRTRYGIDVDGHGALAFCPCLGTPLKVEFDRALVAPPGDLILTSPTVRVYDVPVMHLPYFWLRSYEKIGVLPPDLAYRGTDGLFVGDGIHLPWRAGGIRQSLDVRAGAYLVHGFATEARLRTETGLVKIRYDRLPGARAAALPGTAANGDDGVLVDARGRTGSAEMDVAWDVDAIRGRRGVGATTDLVDAARPWDRAEAEARLHAGPFTLAEGFRAVARRGGGATDVDAAGPVTTLRTSGAAGGSITYDATVEGGALRVAGASTAVNAASPETLSFARTELGVLGATGVGGLAASLSLRGAADVAQAESTSGIDRAGEARAHAGVPLARAFGDEPGDPLVHTIEPFVEGAVVHAKGDGILGILPGRAPAIEGTAPVGEVGLTSALGSWARRESVDLTIAAGTAYGAEDARSRFRPLGRGRAAASLAWLGLSAEGGVVPGAPSGRAGVARVRIGRSDGLRVTANVASRDGIDPILARLLGGAGLEPEGGILAQEGTTGGAGLVVPWSHAITTSASADADLSARELVAARGGVDLRDKCGCLTLHAYGAHRIGRPGVDVWVALDFAVAAAQ
jgi:hypothetical protein